MDPIHIDFTIPDLSLFIGFGALVFAITTFLAISNHREKFKRFANPLKWLAENYLWIVLPLGTFAIGFAVYEWIWQILPKVGQIITQLTPAEQAPDAIRNLAYAIGALLAAVALSATIPFQLIKVWVNERLAKTTEQGHMTDRITKAVEQLGAEKTVKDGENEITAPNLEVRLGAIYALERIAQDSMRDHIPVMEILCAYVRNNSPSNSAYQLNLDFDSGDWKIYLQIRELSKIPPPRIDIQSAISAIGRRKKRHLNIEKNHSISSTKHKYRLDLRSTNLQGIDFSYLDLSNALLENVNMQGAQLWETNLQEASLWGSNLQGSVLGCANLYLANLASTQLQGAHLSGAILKEARLDSADLQQAELEETSCENANFEGADMHGVHLKNTNLRKANLGWANLKEADLFGAQFDEDTIVECTNFLRASVKETELQNCKQLSLDQLTSMFGDKSTNTPRHLPKPVWAAFIFTKYEFYEKWRAAKSAANL